MATEEVLKHDWNAIITVRRGWTFPCLTFSEAVRCDEENRRIRHYLSTFTPSSHHIFPVPAQMK